MSRLGREIARGLKSLEGQLGGPTFTFAGQSYPCIANEAAASKIFGVGGFTLEADLTIFVREDVLGEVRPAETQTVTYKGRRYRIDKVAELPGDAVIKLVCNDPNKGV